MFSDKSAVKVLGQSESLKELYPALVKAAASAQAVGKDAQNTFHRYAYASAESLLDEARTALTSSGLHAFPMGWVFDAAAPDGVSSITDDAGRSKVVGVIGRVHVRYRLVHLSGEWMDFESSTPVIPEKGRPEDKAEATALTYNFGYFVRGLLMLPRVEAGQVDERKDAKSAAEMQKLATFYTEKLTAAPDMKTLASYGPMILSADFAEETMRALSGVRAARAEALEGEVTKALRAAETLEALNAIKPTGFPPEAMARLKAIKEATANGLGALAKPNGKAATP
jgi:hypothetical protein